MCTPVLKAAPGEERSCVGGEGAGGRLGLHLCSCPDHEPGGLSNKIPFDFDFFFLKKEMNGVLVKLPWVQAGYCFGKGRHSQALLLKLMLPGVGGRGVGLFLGREDVFAGVR